MHRGFTVDYLVLEEFFSFCKGCNPSVVPVPDQGVSIRGVLTTANALVIYESLI